MCLQASRTGRVPTSLHTTLLIQAFLVRCCLAHKTILVRFLNTSGRIITYN